ncbi:hypothetical protein GCM10010277_35300 [Streptomyces longisporoflavus]|nr:hypothetical protein GCM10010277_35300 [Streptomyces longisporoflavus]
MNQPASAAVRLPPAGRARCPAGDAALPAGDIALPSGGTRLPGGGTRVSPAATAFPAGGATSSTIYALLGPCRRTPLLAVRAHCHAAPVDVTHARALRDSAQLSRPPRRLEGAYA